MYRLSSSSEIMKPSEKAKPFPGKNAPEIIRSQNIPDFILSAGSLGYPGISVGIFEGSPLYQPSSSDPQFTIQLEKVQQIEGELLQKSNKFWKLDPPGTHKPDEPEVDCEGTETSEDDDYVVDYCFDDEETVEYYNRYDRAYSARNFRTGYKFVQGQKYCITSDNIFSWESDKCYDKTWVAVHGMEIICMVTRRQHVDMARVDEFYQEMCTNLDTMCSYASTVVSEVEFLPYDDEEFNVNNLFRQYGQIIEKPFGLVCVVSDTKKGHEESGHEVKNSISGSATSGYRNFRIQELEGEDIWADEYDAVRRANIFLKEKLAGGLPFNYENTVQTAIRTFQHLCPEELKAEDIWVTTLHIAGHRVDHMLLIARKRHLAAINGDTSGVIDFTCEPSLVPRQVFNPGSTSVHHETAVRVGSESDDGCVPSLVSKEGEDLVPKFNFDNPFGPCDNTGPFSSKSKIFGRFSFLSSDSRGPFQ